MSFLAAGMAAGLNQGLGQGLGNMVQNQLNLRTAGHKAMADMYSKLAESYQDNPQIMGEFLKRANAHVAAYTNPFDQNLSKTAKDGDADPVAPITAFHNSQILDLHNQAGVQPDKNSFINGGKSLTTNPLTQSSGTAPTPPSNMATPATVGATGPPTSPQPLYDRNAPLPEQWTFDPAGHRHQSSAYTNAMAIRADYDKSMAEHQSNLDYMSRITGQAGGSNIRPVDQWHALRAAMGNKEADQYKTGTWTDAKGVHNHEQLTLSGGRIFDRAGDEVPANIPISFTTPHYVYDQNGNLVDVGTVDTSKTPISKPPLTRTSNRTVDPWTGGSSTTSTTTYGKGGGRATVSAPPSTRVSSAGTTKSAAPSAQLDTALPAGTEATTPDPNIPPEIKGDKRFTDAVSALVNRHASLSDFPKLVRPHLAAAMPEGIRAAENPADLANLVSADKAMSLIQSRIQEVRDAAKPVNGKSILDSLTNRAAIAAILNPPPSSEGPGLYGQGSALLGNIGQSLVRGNVDPKVLNYVTKLRQLRDDILALRKFLGNAPMRSNSQMAIQLAQVPDASTSSYKDLDQTLKAFETTPTAAQGMQGGGKPSAPGTSTSIAPPNTARKTYNNGKYYSDDGGLTKYDAKTGKKVQ